MQIQQVDFSKPEHQKAFAELLDAYMLDDMGMQQPLDFFQARKVIDDLRQHPSYLGFMVKDDDEYLALANCFVNYSTFAARRLINIHDFVVHPRHRRKGAGLFLLSGIAEFAEKNGFCRINLEVREDNHKVQQLYRKFGFKECAPKMFFWEKRILI
jgi:ribosomal protein S18 acetylase RimI-like enzyme